MSLFRGLKIIDHCDRLGFPAKARAFARPIILLFMVAMMSERRRRFAETRLRRFSGRVLPYFRFFRWLKPIFFFFFLFQRVLFISTKHVYSPS